MVGSSLFPFELAIEALYEVRHRFIRATCLLLIVTRLLRLALLAGEETVLVADLAVLGTRPIRSVGLHPSLLGLALLSLELGAKEVFALHLYNIRRCYPIIE